MQYVSEMIFGYKGAAVVLPNKVVDILTVTDFSVTRGGSSHDGHAKSSSSVTSRNENQKKYLNYHFLHLMIPESERNNLKSDSI